MSRTRIAYQGVAGAFGELAAVRFGGEESVALPCRSFADVFAALSSEQAEYAVLPYVNSLAGPVRESCSLLAHAPIRVLDDLGIPVALALIAPPGVDLALVRDVYSHPVALRQCKKLFRRHPGWRPLEAFDTAGAVAEVMAAERKDRAAIAHAGAAALYDAEILLDDVQDSGDNLTRFVLIERSSANLQVNDKCA